MGYDFELWRKRHIERNDLSSELVHLTRSTESKSSIENLYQILESKILNGSKNTGFIVGETPAVCFQDAPLYTVGQNCWFEKTFREENKWAKKRYDPTGLIFKKQYIYSNGGRPVIYDSTESAKAYLDKREWWRIVNFNLTDNSSIIDWTHEREWRVPIELKFELADVVLLFANNSDVNKFMKLCDASETQFYREVRGITTMESIIC
ncbi:hypothetical protein [Malaciobacter marinus]|uniref:hypothetical protein n=1 Tax=Malaciobacter marinus TaxID=505249 RepID=UPI003B00CBD1